MSEIVGTKSSLTWAVNISVVLLVLAWTVPTLGLFVSSLRDRDQITASGWWTTLTTSERNVVMRALPPDRQQEDGGEYVLKGNMFDAAGGDESESATSTAGVDGDRRIIRFGFSSRDPAAFTVGESVAAAKGRRLSVEEDGSYEYRSPEPFTGKRGPRIFVTITEPPSLSFDNYRDVIFKAGIGRSFLNTATVTIPATVIPILIAAFAAYALAWMEFPGRALLLAAIVGLLVVPLQMTLIPLLKLHNQLGIGKSYIGIWLAHTGFGLPLAIYLLRNFIAGLPREIIENARVDGASDFAIFRRLILPLSFPALASFTIFQFLWVWNDLLVATVFLGNNESQLVMTGRLRELLGSRGGDWEILAASAFVSIFVPLLVFFFLQRYLVRGLLAGSVKGG